jgi:hypothetical protein
MKGGSGGTFGQGNRFTSSVYVNRSPPVAPKIQYAADRFLAHGVRL